ncbi:hypothetical protein K1719_009636 [Acacia pycnantha]|nr:hypothetical protein K1719_009636 [Acacia pycnantha]
MLFTQRGPLDSDHPHLSLFKSTKTDVKSSQIRATHFIIPPQKSQAPVFFNPSSPNAWLMPMIYKEMDVNFACVRA